MSTREYHREYHAKNKERLNALKREDYAKKKEQYKARARKWNLANKEKRRVIQARRRERQPEQQKTYSALTQLRTEYKVKFRYCAWPGCYETKKIVGHHANYSKPYELIPLCQAHHALWHKRVRDNGKPPETFYSITLRNIGNNRKEKLCLRPC